MLEAVGIDPDTAGDRRPQEFSGGQCQRISIARALMAEPDLLICDEPVSALDVSVQAQILNLLADLKERFGLTMVFIAHDLAVVKNVSDRVAVMYLGKLVEVADSDNLYRSAAHPYTEALLASIPEPDPDRAGTTPCPASSPHRWTRRRAAVSGPAAPTPRTCCAEQEPPLRDISAGPPGGVPLSAGRVGAARRARASRRGGDAGGRRTPRRAEPRTLRRPRPRRASTRPVAAAPATTPPVVNLAPPAVVHPSPHRPP